MAITRLLLLILCILPTFIMPSGGVPDPRLEAINTSPFAPMGALARKIRTGLLRLKMQGLDRHKAIFLKKNPLSSLNFDQYSELSLPEFWPQIAHRFSPLKLYPVKKIPHHASNFMAWSADSKNLLAVSKNTVFGRLDCAIVADNGLQPAIYHHRTPETIDLTTVNVIAYSPSRSKVAIATSVKDTKITNTTLKIDNLVKIYDVDWNDDYSDLKPATPSQSNADQKDLANQKSKLELATDYPVNSLAWLNDDSLAVAFTDPATNNNSIVIWNIQTGSRRVFKIKAIPSDIEVNLKVSSIAAMADGSKIVIGLNDASVMLLDVNTREIKTICVIDSPGMVDSIWNEPFEMIVSCSPNSSLVGRTLYSSSDPENSCKALFATQMHTLNFKLFQSHSRQSDSDKLDPIRLTAWAPDGSRLAASNSKEIFIFDVGPILAADTSFKDQYQRLLDGTLTPEQKMVILLFNQHQQTNKEQPLMKILTEKTARTQNKSPFSLQKIVNYAHSIGDTNITLIELVGKLASFHPMIRKAICQEFNVSLERELDEFLNGKPGNIIKEDYVDLYSAFMQAKTVVPTVAIPEIATVLEEYCIAQRPAIKEKVDGEQAAHDAFVEWSKKLQESQTRQENSAKLFKAISDRDFQAIENDFTLVNPISIIDRSADGLMRTPLMMAMYYHQASAQKEEANPIFKKLLKYSKAVMIRGRRAIGQSDLAATDHTLKTPLMIAIDLGLFNFALRIAQKMEMNEKFKKAFALRNNKGKSALYLAEVAKEEHKSKDDYKALMVILEKHCKS